MVPGTGSRVLLAGVHGVGAEACHVSITWVTIHAKILQQMADTGKMDTAVKVLAAMKPAKASKVLSEMPDSSLAAQLLEKMKSLKPAPGTTPEG